jgi:hypothetical protein
MICVCGMRRLEANGESRNRLCRPYWSGGGREAGAAASEVTNRMPETACQKHSDLVDHLKKALYALTTP